MKKFLRIFLYLLLFVWSSETNCSGWFSSFMGVFTTPICSLWKRYGWVTEEKMNNGFTKIETETWEQQEKSAEFLEKATNSTFEVINDCIIRVENKLETALVLTTALIAKIQKMKESLPEEYEILEQGIKQNLAAEINSVKDKLTSFNSHMIFNFDQIGQHIRATHDDCRSHQEVFSSEIVKVKDNLQDVKQESAECKRLATKKTLEIMLLSHRINALDVRNDAARGVVGITEQTINRCQTLMQNIKLAQANIPLSGDNMAIVSSKPRSKRKKKRVSQSSSYSQRNHKYFSRHNLVFDEQPRSCIFHSSQKPEMPIGRAASSFSGKAINYITQED